MKHILLISFLTLTAIPSIAQWHFVGAGLTNGSEGGLFQAFGVQDTCIFASYADEGVWRYSLSTKLNSDSLILSWTATSNGIDLSFGYVTSITSLGSFLFASLPYSSYVSTNQGTSWSKLEPAGPIAASGTYWLGNSSTVVYISKDSGQNWEPTTCPQAHNFQTDGAYVFASNVKGFWRSTDTGETWMNISVPMSLPVSAFAMVGTEMFAGGKGVYLSTNLGQTWSQISLEDRTVNALASYKNYLFAAIDTGILISSDSGHHWKNVDQGMGTRAGWPRDVTLLAVLDTTLFAEVYTGTDPSNNQYGYATARSIPEMTADTSTASGFVETIPSSDSIEVYPNPTSGSVTVSGMVTNLSVTNVLGQTVLNILDPTNSSLDLSNQPPGVYYIRIQTAGNETETLKLVKQ